MNTALKKHGVDILPGTIIQGKWHENKYTVIRKIGAGVVGTVYLVQAKGRYRALKISRQSHTITIEVNVLKSVQKVQGKRLGPLLVDFDDWQAPDGESYSFYVMEYVRGENIATFIRKNGSDWLGAFLFQLLDQLIKLHDLGWVYGDLKVDHLIVEPSPPNARLIDFGGTTKQGRGIKEFTEFYDRGYWQLGSRKAEPSYDLFSLVILCLHIFYSKEFSRGTEPRKVLFKKIRETQALRIYEPILKKALIGKYSSGREMRSDLEKVIYYQDKKSSNRVRNEQSRLKPLLIDVGIFSLLLTIYSLLAVFLP